MTRWTCGIAGDSRTFDRVEDLVVHQATEHDRVECRVCGALVPDGYFAIKHAMDDHSRSEFVRAFEADSEAVRLREKVIDTVESEADLEEIVERVDGR